MIGSVYRLVTLSMLAVLPMSDWISIYIGLYKRDLDKTKANTQQWGKDIKFLLRFFLSTDQRKLNCS
jgi:hypothetical protein